MKLRELLAKRRELPTRDQLEAAANPRRRAAIALGVLAALVTLAATWWSRHGRELIDETIFHLETIHLYWNHVATPSERTAWTWLVIAMLLLTVLAVVLLHRFVWRALFPDLVRLDEHAHPGGHAERIGRLYRVRAFRDGDVVRYRHSYKHGGRWLPLFRFDFVDLDSAARSTVFGVSMIRCGRLDRDPKGNRFRRIPNADAFGAHALATSFREREVVEDQDRKSSIVMPGPGMNPEVMRKKWQAERLHTRWAAELEDDEIDTELEEALARARTE